MTVRGHTVHLIDPVHVGTAAAIPAVPAEIGDLVGRDSLLINAGVHLPAFGTR
ncbi:hypothetical protein [Nocardia nova]|uniref:hypothetical protein n=1 Tax=Nocardia nova TaxID=37330 RepID=UPI0004AD1A90|nr:hypothetical protein [Nocardia nova]